jgi:hypothetical protein
MLCLKSKVGKKTFAQAAFKLIDFFLFLLLKRHNCDLNFILLNFQLDFYMRLIQYFGAFYIFL